MSVLDLLTLKAVRSKSLLSAESTKKEDRQSLEGQEIVKKEHRCLQDLFTIGYKGIGLMLRC